MLQYEIQRDSIFALQLQGSEQENPDQNPGYIGRHHYVSLKLHAVNQSVGDPTGVALAWGIGIMLWAYIFARWVYRKRK